MEYFPETLYIKIPSIQTKFLNHLLSLFLLFLFIGILNNNKNPATKKTRPSIYNELHLRGNISMIYDSIKEYSFFIISEFSSSITAAYFLSRFSF